MKTVWRLCGDRVEVAWRRLSAGKGVVPVAVWQTCPGLAADAKILAHV
jgi:hypothetical protein